VVSRADSALTPEEHDLYTDYVIDVTRVFRMPAIVSRRTPGATEVSPFVAAAPVSRPGASSMQVRVRAVYHGRLALEGGGRHPGHRVSDARTGRARDRVGLFRR